MLTTKVWIFNPTSLGGGQYTADIYFQDPTRPQYARLGDYIRDTVGNEYELVSATLPLSDGSTGTFQFVTNDVLPQVDSGYNSDFYTPDQIDLRPEVHTAGEVFSRTLYSGPDYEYELNVAWSLSSEEQKAEVGDRIVDANGKEFELTFIDPVSRFGVACRASEVIKEGILPSVGISTLYRSTSNYNFYQGTELDDPARTYVRNRDFTLIDALIASGSGGGGGSASIEKTMESSHTSAIPINTPVSKKTDGTIVPADSDAADGQVFIGITSEEIASGSQGIVKLVGQNITGALTGLGFAVGDDVYLAETGGYTNDPNSFTGDDDSIIRIGVADCSEGTASSTANDLIMFPEVLIRP